MIPKFRAFWKSEKKMIYVDWIRFGNKDLIGKVDGQTILPVGLEDVVLMQSTGLKDSGGDEIWEGDIIKWTYSDGPDFVQNGQTEVVFEDGAFRPGKGADEDLAEFIDFYDHGFVIGNIHQHPHLVEGL